MAQLAQIDYFANGNKKLSKDFVKFITMVKV